MSSVGRPPEVDSEGNTVQKCLVNVTIPTKLANFLKEKGINRSKLFRGCVMKLYKGELCLRCYGTDLHKGLVGIWCAECEPAAYKADKYFHFTTYFNCENVSTHKIKFTTSLLHQKQLERAVMIVFQRRIDNDFL